ncbi:MAG TPA: DUF4124 domain-containing protein [Pseudomonas sp.]|nr:DUF4124 domain-containing protein [Pseudomonas sp.]
MRRIILTGSLLLALSSSAMAGQVYKWVDAQGNTHFGAQPPQGQEATSINTVVAPPKAAAPAAPSLPSFEDDAEQKAADAKVKKAVAAEEAELKKYCESVRTNLAQLRNNPRVMTEVLGEPRRLTEEERQARIAESEKNIAENCK